MNNIIVRPFKLNKSHCVVGVSGHYFYIDFTGHIISKISQEFVNIYGLDDIINLNLSVKELMDSLPDFTMEDD